MPPAEQDHPVAAPSDDAFALRRRRADMEHDLFATIVEDAFSEILAFDAESLDIILANKSLRSNLRYSPSEIVGLNVAEIKSEYSTARLREIYHPLLQEQTSKLVVRTVHRRKDGTTYPVEVHSRKSQFNGRPVIFQIAIDQTAIKQKQIRAELASGIERDAAEAKNSRAFLAALLARLSRQFKCQLAHVYLWRDDAQRLESTGIWHVETMAAWQADFRKLTEKTPLASGEGLPGQAHARKEAAILEELGRNLAFTRRAAFPDLPGATGFAMPILAGDEVTAVLEFFSLQDFTPQIWPALVQSLRDQVNRLYERKCGEERVNESRERFDAAVNGAAVGLWDYSYKHNHFYLSPRCREILRIAEDQPPPSWEAFGKRIHPKDVRRTAVAMKAHMLKRTPYDVEYRYAVSEGQYIWLHSRARGVWDDDGNIIRTAGTIEDISGEKEAERVQHDVLACIAAPSDTATKITQALDKVCGYLGLHTALVSHVADGAFEVRYRSSDEAGPKLKETMPLSDTICSDVYSGDVLQAFPDLAQSAAANHPARGQSHIEAYIGITLFVKGVRFGTLSFTASEPRKVFSEAEVAMVRLLARWIGEEIGRASDVAALIENDVRTSSQLASAADALLTVDQNGRIEDANPAATRMFHWPLVELRQMSIAALLPTVKSFSRQDGRLIPAQSRQDMAVRKDGKRISVLLNIAEIHPGGRTLYTVAISDLTKVKQAETAKGEFISVVSHELRTPLTSIRGALGLITSRTTGPLTPETARIADIAQRNCERLLRLVNDILAIEKLESGQFEMTLQPVDLNSILTDAVTANALYAAKFDARFRLSLAEDLPSVIADGERLVQVMANLLSNAAKFTRPGTTVSVTSERAGKYARISVRDQGQGIPEAMQDRIFEKFVQGESANTRGHEGSGLGLSITRQMVEQMNGEISFASQAGAGTTFTVSLPMADIDKAQLPETEKMPAGATAA